MSGRPALIAALALALSCAAASSAAAAAYDDFARGQSANQQGLYADAITAFTAALEEGGLNPSFLPIAYQGRARAYLATGLCAPAFADLTAALKLKPDDGTLLMMHAQTALCLDKSDAVRTDLAALPPPGSPNEMHLRGRLLFDIGDYEGAQRQFAAFLERQTERAVYGALWLEVSRLRAGTLDPAVAAKDAAAFTASDWPVPLLALYAGNAKPEDVAAAALRGPDSSAQGRQCEADYYAAEWWLGHGDAATARPLFQRAADKCPRNFLEFGQAQLELRRLK